MAPPPAPTSPVLQLASVVSRLQATCPWTSQQTTADFLEHCRNELREVEHVLQSAKNANADAPRQGASFQEALSSELGDAVFTVMMLAAACARLYGTDGLDGASERMVEKLRRRAPYAFEDGPKVHSAEEAMALWQVRCFLIAHSQTLGSSCSRSVCFVCFSHALTSYACMHARTHVARLIFPAGRQASRESRCCPPAQLGCN